MKSKRIVVGMSGGVDSSVTAALLLEQGYDVTGVFIEAYNEPGCRTDEDKKDALKVATKLGIPFRVLDLRREYKEKVVNYFVSEYKKGRTPNPDVMCNGEIKFGLFLEWVLKQGFEKLATGHYANINGEGLLVRPKDLSKDQTYFLWKVSPEKLKKVLFPLGELTKVQVREKAKELELPNAEKPDSMGICMMGELSIYEFLKDKIGEKKGKVFWNNEEVGIHNGEWFYTIGQRGGWKIMPSKQTTTTPALYVKSKDAVTNTLYVGEREKCYINTFKVENLEWFLQKQDLSVRIRNLGELTKVKSISGNLVETEIPIFAPAAGQSAVFYTSEGVVAGGGMIAY